MLENLLKKNVKVKLSAAIKVKKNVTKQLQGLGYFGDLVKCLLKIKLTEMVAFKSMLHISGLKLRASYNEA